jgi:hypothetical protein
MLALGVIIQREMYLVIFLTEQRLSFRATLEKIDLILYILIKNQRQIYIYIYTCHSYIKKKASL